MFKVCSPYLKLLSEKGVNWQQSLTPELLARVQSEDKMIFLHIGYISNINLRESSLELFGNNSVAELLNKEFISIAEDKDDNPESFLLALDLLFLNKDFSYGPVNIFITPDRKPLVCFSDCNPEYFISIAQDIIKAKKEKRELLDKLADEFSKRVLNTGIIKETGKIPEINSQLLFNYIQKWFHRMFESDFLLNVKPYTPNPNSLFTVLSYLKINPDTVMLENIDNFLDRLQFSALFDPINGGFFRQATDYTCSEPLFEKTLEENSQYLQLFAAAYDLFGKESYKETAYVIYNFVINELKNEGGGYCSSTTLINKIEDSVYYSYSINEMSIMFPDRYQEISVALGFDTTASETEQQIPLRTSDLYSVISDNELQVLKGRRKEHRGYFKDSRIITSYNAQFSRGAAAASVYLNDKSMYKTALETFDYLINNNLNSNEQLLRYTCCSSGCTRGYLSDYADFISAAVELYKVENGKVFALVANKYLDYLIENFYKQENGMFSKSEKDRDNIIVPFKRESNIDIMKPSANSVMAGNLIEMYKISGNKKYLEIAERQINNIASDLINSGPLLSSWAHKILLFITLPE
ncbi:MAG: Thymidylate kinase [uncultured bacterium]|nr:MAG: Thymidylate kinase [uncultured bacterium]